MRDTAATNFRKHLLCSYLLKFSSPSAVSIHTVSGTISRLLLLRSKDCNVFSNMSTGNSQFEMKLSAAAEEIAISTLCFSTSANPSGPQLADN